MKSICKNLLTSLVSYVLLMTALLPFRAHGQQWSDHIVRSLPASSFALVEVDKKGNQVCHFPYRDINGNIDFDQLIYCLGTFSRESWIEPHNKELARKTLEEQYHRFKLKQVKEGIPEPLNINKASLKDLVLLPNIGPVTAVKIYEFRETNGPFQNIEDVEDVEGIGPAIFAGIRYYIKVK